MEIHPRLARDFSQKLRGQIERQLAPLTRDLGHNIGRELGDSVGETFAARFGDHALAAVEDLRLADISASEGARAGDEFGREFRGRALPSFEGLGRDIELHLTRRLGGALAGTTSLASGLSKLAASALAVSGAVSTAAGAIGVATQGALALGLALAPATGAFAALPGAVLLGAGALGTLNVALSGVADGFAAALSGDYLEFVEGTAHLSRAAGEVAYELFQMSGAFQGIRRQVQDALFAPLVGEMWSLLDTINAVGAGMTGVAEAFGEGARELLEFARAGETIWAIESVFRSLRDAVESVIPALRPLLNGFRDLGVVGAHFLSQLAPGIAEAAENLGWFMYHAAASGDALRWMEGALAVFRQLGALIGDVGGIIGAVFRALRDAGGDALGIIGQLISGVHEFFDGAHGQQALITIFRTLAEIGRALLPVVQELGTALIGLAPIIAQIANLVGPILTSAIQALAPALAEVGPALVAVFNALYSAVFDLATSGALTLIGQALAEILMAVTPLVSALGMILVPILETIASVANTILVPALQTLANWFWAILTAITSGIIPPDHPLAGFAAFVTGTLIPAIQNLWDLITRAFGDIASWIASNRGTFEEWGARIQGIVSTVQGIFQQLWDLIVQVFNDIVAWITSNQETWQGWGDRILSIAQNVANVVSGAFELISIAWNTFGAPLLDLVSAVFNGILAVVDGVMKALHGLIESVLGLITGDWERAWNGLKTFLEGIWDAITGALDAALKVILQQLSWGLNLFDVTWRDAWNAMSAFLSRTWDSIVSGISRWIDSIVSWFNRLADLVGRAIASIRDGAVQRFNDLLSFVASIPARIYDTLAGLGSWMHTAGWNLIIGLWNGVVDAWNKFIEWWNSAVGGLIDAAKRILGIASPSREFLAIGRDVGAGLIDGVASMFGGVRDAVAALADHALRAWGDVELPIGLAPETPASWRTATTARVPTVAGQVSAGQGADRVYNVTVNAAPTIPTERQIVTALSYADALYA